MIQSMSDMRQSFFYSAAHALVTLALSDFSYTQEIKLPAARRSRDVQLGSVVRPAVEKASMITGARVKINCS
jgi:hypothetical protein